MPLAVVITVLDSTTGTSVAEGARGFVRDGTYADSLRPITTGAATTVLVGGNKVGTYEVTTERNGYREWDLKNVQVTQQGPCGNVIPVQLTALLQRNP